MRLAKPVNRVVLLMLQPSTKQPIIFARSCVLSLFITILIDLSGRAVVSSLRRWSERESNPQPQRFTVHGARPEHHPTTFRPASALQKLSRWPLSYLLTEIQPRLPRTSPLSGLRTIFSISSSSTPKCFARVARRICLASTTSRTLSAVNHHPRWAK